MRTLRKSIIGMIVLGASGITAFWLMLAINHNLLAHNWVVHTALIVGCTSLVAAFVMWRIECRLTAGHC